MPTLDMTEGVYRRIYSGFLDNAKVNSVSWMAEAWFWRLVVLADDFGNLKGNWRHLAVNASPVREIDAAQAKALTLELVKAKLVELYQVDDKQYIHIKGFTERQPANKNGRRIQKEPMNPEESGCESVHLGESGGIQTNPEESSASDSDSDSDSDSEPEAEANRDASVALAATKKKSVNITAEQFVTVWRDRGHSDSRLMHAVEEFHQHRTNMRKPISALAASKLVTVCEGFTVEEIIAEIEKSIASGYQGLRPTRQSNKFGASLHQQYSRDAVFAKAAEMMGIK
jgi:hypothetical protein